MMTQHTFGSRLPMPKWLLTLLLLPLLLLIGQTSAHAQPNGLEMTVSAAFDGYYQANDPVPVTVTVSNDGAPLEGELRLETGSATVGDAVVYTAPISLPTQSSKQVFLLVSLPQINDELTVELVNDSGQVVMEAESNRLEIINRNDILVGVVSPDMGAFSRFEEVVGGSQRARVANLSLDTLPDIGVAYNALDILVLDETDTSRLTPAQLEALDGWVQTGGQLLVTGGPNWQPTVAAIRDWLPVTISGTETVDSLPALAAFGGADFRDAGPYLLATSSLTEGELLVHEDGLPLMATRPRGQGSVTFVALDPKLAPLRDWNGTLQLWRSLANNLPEPPPWALGMENNYAAREAVSSLPSLTLPSVLGLALFILVYILVIGPINYFVLKRMNRREWAWITIPALVLIFSAVTYLVGFQIKGNDVIVNQMNVAIGNADSDYGRVTTAIGLYSPRRDVYTLTLPGSTAPGQLPYVYGTDRTNIDAIVRDRDVAIRDIRTDVSEVAVWQVHAIAPLPGISAETTIGSDDSGNIQITISAENDGTTPLTDVSLLAGDTAYPLPDLAPGDGWEEVLTLTRPSTSARIYGPGSAYTLTNNAETLLRTVDFFNDAQAYPRWQLLQAIGNSTTVSSSTGTTSAQDETLTLIGWNDEALISAEIGQPVQQTATTLYLLDVPLTTSAIGGGTVTVPSSLLTWQEIDNEGIYDPTPHNLYMNGGRLDISFEPWPQFDGLQVESLEIVVETPGLPSENLAPEVWLFNREADNWQQLEDADWGRTAVADFAPFLDDSNQIQIRLVDRSPFGVEVQEFYPAMTGEITP